MPCAGAVNVSVNNQSMNYRNAFIILFPFLLIGCNNSYDKKSVTSKKKFKRKN